jgi:hypothetical protein
MTDKRIYVVLANVVQAPLDIVVEENSLTNKKVRVLKNLPETRATYQPAGRLVAQAAHIVSKVREKMTKRDIIRYFSGHNKPSLNLTNLEIFNLAKFESITTIVLGARDSFELAHVYTSLEDAGISVHEFKDSEQPDYGDSTWEVTTAIATEPVTSSEVLGILDYLPLWEPNFWDIHK